MQSLVVLIKKHHFLGGFIFISIYPEQSTTLLRFILLNKKEIF